MSILTTLTRAWLTRSFKPFRFTNTYDNTFDYKNTRNLGLYVHIPFCRTLCDFCPYCKYVYDKDIANQYIEALLKEIDMVGRATQEDKKQVTSLYFGGTLRFSYDIKRIIERINKIFYHN